MMIRIFFATIAALVVGSGVGSAQEKVRPERVLLDQLVANGCWQESDLPDAEPMRTMIRVKFGRDGHLSEPPLLVEPQEMPRDGSPLGAFVRRAFRALEKCNAIGFRVPDEYFSMGSPTVDFLFISRAGDHPVG